MLTTALTIAEVLYVLAVSAWIILEKRPPLATLAWILGLAALPLVGFFVYWFIGPRRLKRRRARRAVAVRRLRASLPDFRVLGDHVLGIEPRQRQLMALALNGGTAPLTAGNSVRILRNGQETFPALEEAIASARHHVHLEYYIFAPDRTGVRLRDLLIERAKAGVHVRLLVDAVGGVDLNRAFLAPLLKAGGEIGWFNVVSFGRFRPRVNFRNHRKIVVCDARVGFLGGLNVSDDYAGIGGRFGTWRDTHARIEGPAIRALQLLFLEDWNFATRRSVTDTTYFAPPPTTGNSVVQILGSGPDGDWQSIQQVFFTAIASAQERLSICTPYFVPDDAILTALYAAALRGVDVRLLVPRRSDLVLVAAAGRSYYDDLLRAGVRIYEYLPGFLHAKTLVMDGLFAIVGSANFDQRSFRLNFEVSAVCYDAEIARQLESLFEEDLTLSREITTEERQALTLPSRFAEASARLLSPLL